MSAKYFPKMYLFQACEVSITRERTLRQDWTSVRSEQNTRYFNIIEGTREVVKSEISDRPILLICPDSQ